MMPRILVYDHLDQPLFELDPNKVYGLKMVEKVNDEHSLTITTSHELEKGQRIFYHDGEKLREFVVLGDVASHADGFSHEYYCVWSLQYDLSAAYIDDRRIGNKNNLVPASDILTVIAGQSRWQVGTVTTTTVSSAWLYYKSLWEALGIVVENWQGEVDSTIVLSSPVARYIDFKAHIGSSDAKRRFDYGHDLTSIKRTVLDDLYVCRIVPRGKGEAVEGEGGEVSGYGRRITIESVNPTGEEWIQDDSVVPLVRLPNGSGGYEYPTSIVIFDSIETPQVLYDTAMAELETYTRPKMSYEASVLALSGAGMDVDGVSLGDTVHVVDTTFGEDGLRLSARVLGIERDLLEPSNDKLTIGNFQPKMSDTVKDLIDGLSAAQEQLIDTDAKADSAISDASEAAQIAVEAQTVANAINQHFWVDTDGAHVTEVTKDEWNDTTGSRYHTGANSLWNSLGMLFRKGLTNLLAIVTSNTGGSATGISIYDGQGNGAENIVASFTGSGVTVGRDGEQHVEIATESTDFFNLNGTLVGRIGSGATEAIKYTRSTPMVMGESGFTASAVFSPLPDFTAGTLRLTDDDGLVPPGLGILPIYWSVELTSYGTVTDPDQGITVTAAQVDSSRWSIEVTGTGNQGGNIVFAHYWQTGAAPFYEFGTATASGRYAFAEGVDGLATGDSAHTEGQNTTSSGIASHAEGNGTTASAEAAHAEGKSTTASWLYSHAEGKSTTASGRASHAEGESTTASWMYSHAEGKSTTASGRASHAEGESTTASGRASHAQGMGTIASSAHQTALGIWNVEDTSDVYAEIVGNGAADNARSNARTLDWDGNEVLAGGLTLGTPLAVANGGTGATNATNARSNLLAVGYQSGMNAQVSNFTGADQLFGLSASCTNANNALNGKRVSLIVRNDGLMGWNISDSSQLWSVQLPTGTISFNNAFTSTVAQVITAASGFTISQASYVQNGRMGQWYMTVKTTNAMSANTQYTIGTIVSGKRPAVWSPVTFGETSNAYGNGRMVAGGGVLVRPSANIAAGSSFYLLCPAYILG